MFVWDFDVRHPLPQILHTPVRQNEVSELPADRHMSGTFRHDESMWWGCLQTIGHVESGRPFVIRPIPVPTEKHTKNVRGIIKSRYMVI